MLFLFKKITQILAHCPLFCFLVLISIWNTSFFLSLMLTAVAVTLPTAARISFLCVTPGARHSNYHPHPLIPSNLLLDPLLSGAPNPLDCAKRRMLIKKKKSLAKRNYRHDTGEFLISKLYIEPYILYIYKTWHIHRCVYGSKNRHYYFLNSTCPMGPCLPEHSWRWINVGGSPDCVGSANVGSARPPTY